MNEELRKRIMDRVATLDERWTQCVDWAMKDLPAFNCLGEMISECYSLPTDEASMRLASIVAASPKNFSAMLMITWVEIELRLLQRTEMESEGEAQGHNAGEGG